MAVPARLPGLAGTSAGNEAGNPAMGRSRREVDSFTVRFGSPPRTPPARALDDAASAASLATSASTLVATDPDWDRLTSMNGKTKTPSTASAAAMLTGTSHG